MACSPHIAPSRLCSFPHNKTKTACTFDPAPTPPPQTPPQTPTNTADEFASSPGCGDVSSNPNGQAADDLRYGLWACWDMFTRCVLALWGFADSQNFGFMVCCLICVFLWSFYVCGYACTGGSGRFTAAARSLPRLCLCHCCVTLISHTGRAVPPPAATRRPNLVLPRLCCCSPTTPTPWRVQQTPATCSECD